MMPTKSRFLTCLALLAALSLGTAQAADDQTKLVDQPPAGAIFATAGGKLRLQAYSDRVVRVTFTAGEKLPDGKSLAVVGSPTGTSWRHLETPAAFVFQTKVLQIVVDRQTGAVTFRDASDQPILSEIAGHSTGARQSFTLRPGEEIYGLGQHQDGAWNYRGSTVHLQQRNTEIAVPVLVSSAGYGLFWDNAAVTDVAVGAGNAKDTLTWTSESGNMVDYYFFYGPSADEIVHGYRQLTGAAPMFGRWAWGYWQSRERYKTQQELLDVAREYRRRQIPIDGMVQDWQYWAPQPWGSHAFGPGFPDPKGMMDELHAANFHAIISVWAKFSQGSRNYDELDHAGFLYPPIYNDVYPVGKARWYDAFNPDARRMYWRQMSDEIFARGFDGWWLDATEPELGGHWGEMRDLPTFAGPGRDVFDAYPLMTTGGVYQGQRAQTADKRVFILTRSAYAGQQRNAAVAWSGDIHGDWATFKKQVPAGLNFVASGIPYWNTDIGGFFSGSKDDESYRELFVRWYQFGAFCPMFRVHGTGTQKEMWSFGPEIGSVLLKYDRLRYRLLPYIYSTAWKVTDEDYTMMRPLFMDFGADAAARTVFDQFMFGPALMACPVTAPGGGSVQKRRVYLPPGTWYDFWTGQRLPGAQSLAVETPLETMPLYVRAGAILPLGPEVQNAQEKADPIELRVYRGADGTFTLYDDEGDGYGYEKGAHSTIPFSWDEKAGTLTIGERVGSFPGMLAERTFQVVLVGKVSLDKPESLVHYTGKSVTIKP